MSRSIHQTTKSVFRGKSKAEIADMIETRDADLMALVKKGQTKRDVKTARLATKSEQSEA